MYLCPAQHDFKIDNLLSFVEKIRDIKFISKKIETLQANNNYMTGDSFLEYISYMGCSPAIQFEPDENNKEFCHIKIHQYETAKLIVSNKQARAPHCPVCEKPVKNWQQKKSDAGIYCDHCNNSSNIEAFNWRKMAGYAQLYIEITDIFPKEAVPQQTLLDKLTAITNVKWLYFYCCR